jgi:hypothetical protein
MIIQSGAKEGKSTQQLILKAPDWADFFMGKNPTSKVTLEFKKHINDLNNKPFVVKCTTCSKPATRCTAYQGNTEDLYFWCNTCDPYSHGANMGKLSVLVSYQDVIRFAKQSDPSSRGAFSPQTRQESRPCP